MSKLQIYLRKTDWLKLSYLPRVSPLATRHRLTRHQYYLQLRKDILEDRLYCNEETGLFLVALALQAEFGDYMPEVQTAKTKILTFCL